jgi:hypothetical protein
VTGEVDADGQPGAGAGQRLDQDIDSRPFCHSGNRAGSVASART